MFDGSCLSLLWKHASFFQHLLLNICIMTPIHSYYGHPLTDFFCCWNFEEAMEKREESASEESPKEGVLHKSHQKKECFIGVTKRRRKRKTPELEEATYMSLSSLPTLKKTSWLRLKFTIFSLNIFL